LHANISGVRANILDEHGNFPYARVRKTDVHDNIIEERANIFEELDNIIDERGNFPYACVR